MIERAFILQKLAYYWGVFGVVGIISSAIYRLFPRIIEMQSYALDTVHWAVLLIFTLYMIYAEGYKGFHLNFSPRVVVRARHLRSDASLIQGLLAPLFCMGFFGATKKRMIISYAVTSGIILLVVLVSHSPQPWRGVIDTGVISGLLAGIMSLLWYWLQEDFGKNVPDIPADLPG